MQRKARIASLTLWAARCVPTHPLRLACQAVKESSDRWPARGAVDTIGSDGACHD